MYRENHLGSEVNIDENQDAKGRFELYAMNV